MNRNNPAPNKINPELYFRFANLVNMESGLYFDVGKESAMRIAINERMSALGISDYQSYYDYLISSKSDLNLVTESNLKAENSSNQELQRLLDILVVNETTFFRNREHFDAIRLEVLPRLIKRNQSIRHLRFWSAGCSTGPEPYSLAIAAIEALEMQGQKVGGTDGWKIEITATDISEKALKVARAGRYRIEELRNLQPEQISRFFISPVNPNAPTVPLNPAQLLHPTRPSIIKRQDKAFFEVSSLLRQTVNFNHFNLAIQNYPAEKLRNFDLILCENVTIYFSPEVTKQVINNLFDSLTPGGWFFIGYSETLWQVSDRFKLINSNETFYYQKPYPNEVLPPAYTRSRSVTGPLSLNSRKITDELNPTVVEKVIKSLPEQFRQKTTTPNNLDNSFVKKPDEVIVKPENVSISPVPEINPAIERKLHSDQLLIKKPVEKILTNELIQNSKGWEEALSLGLKKMAEHDFEHAQQYLDEANKLQANNVKILCAIAQLKAKLGDYKEAKDLSCKAIALDSLCEDGHLMLAMIYYYEGRVPESIEEFERTIYINFDSVVAHMRLADIYRSMGQKGGALREYRNAIKALNKKNPNEIIEDLPAELLKRTCQQNINRLSGK